MTSLGFLSQKATYITTRGGRILVGALAVVIAIRSVLSGAWSKENSFLATVADSIPDSAVRDRINEYLTFRVPPWELAFRFGTSGWVLDTVPLALYCAQFIVEKPLSVVLSQAIEAGGDTDTIASITGQIAGTVSGVPADHSIHFSRINEGEEIIRIGERFADFLCEREKDASLGKLR